MKVISAMIALFILSGCQWTKTSLQNPSKCTRFSVRSINGDTYYQGPHGEWAPTKDTIRKAVLDALKENSNDKED